MIAGKQLFLIALCSLVALTACTTVFGQDADDSPRNIILFIGDGMGLAQVELAAYQRTGSQPGPTPGIYFQDFPVTGLATTHSANSFVTDSAAAATAFACGVKTQNGVLGLDADGNPVDSILKIAHERGMATGVVTSVPLNHATPAGFIANVGGRGESDNIINQYLDMNVADVILGGGILLGDLTADAVRDRAVADGYDWLTMDNVADLQSVEPGDRLFGFFENSDDGHLAYVDDRAGDDTDEPRLVDLSIAAVRALSGDEDGFFVMIEGGAIDWAGHGNDPVNVTNEVYEFETAIEAVCFELEEMGLLDDTLIIVTADHETGALTLIGPYGSPLAAGDLCETSFASTNHSATPVPVYATGPGSEAFAGRCDNTDLFLKMRDALTD